MNGFKRLKHMALFLFCLLLLCRKEGPEGTYNGKISLSPSEEFGYCHFQKKNYESING